MAKEEDPWSWLQFIGTVRDNNKFNNIVEFRVTEVSWTFVCEQCKPSQTHADIVFIVRQLIMSSMPVKS